MSSYAKYKNLGEQTNTAAAGGNTSPVLELVTREQKNKLFREFKIVVIDVYADWCGPCKQIAPRFEKIANELYQPGECILVKENVESGISDGIRGVPTFQIVKNGVLFASVVGADMNELLAKIKEARST